MESINTHCLTLVPMPDSNVTHCMSLDLFSAPLSTDGTYRNTLSHNECCCTTLNKIWHTTKSNIELSSGRHITQLCEHAQCARYMNLRYIPYFCCFSEHFTSIPFYFVVYSIYASHPFASGPHRDNRNIIPYLVLITRTIMWKILVRVFVRLH